MNPAKLETYYDFNFVSKVTTKESETWFGGPFFYKKYKYG